MLFVLTWTSNSGSERMIGQVEAAAAHFKTIKRNQQSKIRV
jgi:hypothetical protein